MSVERYWEICKFSTASKLGIGRTAVVSIASINPATSSSDVEFGKTNKRLSPLTSQSGFRAAAQQRRACILGPAGTALLAIGNIVGMIGLTCQ